MKVILSTAILFISGFASNSFAYDQIVHRFSAEGAQAERLYKILQSEDRASTAANGVISIEEGVKCVVGQTKSCETTSYDGDPKSLETSSQLYPALLAAGVNLNRFIQTLQCQEGPAKGIYFCRFEEEMQ